MDQYYNPNSRRNTMRQEELSYNNSNTNYNYSNATNVTNDSYPTNASNNSYSTGTNPSNSNAYPVANPTDNRPNHSRTLSTSSVLNDSRRGSSLVISPSGMESILILSQPFRILFLLCFPPDFLHLSPIFQFSLNFQLCTHYLSRLSFRGA
jgi:hypothetical protein